MSKKAHLHVDMSSALAVILDTDPLASRSIGWDVSQNAPLSVPSAMLTTATPSAL